MIGRMPPTSSLTPRSRSHAALSVLPPDPGRYLAVDDGAEVVLVALRGELTRIGRSATADIAFDDGSVSRRHAVIMVEGSRVEIADDSSLNGTYVNGARINRRALLPGDEIAIGRRTLRFVEIHEHALPATDEVVLAA
jgi:pSer/pThr/pTyr-binding forkhead associated (FHA) protein